MLEKCLKDKFLVYTADSAKKALELLNVAPDIILLDINMPEMDGLELCRLIRSHISCPIIFLTARVMEEDVIKGLSVGGDDYITKPFGMDELLARISAHLRREERKSAASNMKFDEELIINYNSHTVFYGEIQLEFSNKEFEIRFAVVIILNYYITEDYIDLVLETLDEVKHEGYYVKMAVAWAISLCFVKFEEKTMNYLKNNKLDDFTYNKSLQKICESLRVDKDTKAIIKSMKR